MDEFPGILAKDFGFRPQGKAAPMTAAKVVPGAGSGRTSSAASVPLSSSSYSSSTNRSKPVWDSSLLGDPSPIDGGTGSFSGRSFTGYGSGPGGLDGILGGSAKPVNKSGSSSSPTSFGYDSVFDGFNKASVPPSPKQSALPVYDKPVYDDDLFDGIHGPTSSSSAQFDDVFASLSSSSNHTPLGDDDLLSSLSGNGKWSNSSRNKLPGDDDLLGSLNGKYKGSRSSRNKPSSESRQQEKSDFDDLIPGFSSSSPLPKRGYSKTDHHKPSNTMNKSASTTTNDPPADLGSAGVTTKPSSGLFVDPLKDIKAPSDHTKSTTPSSGAFDDTNVFDGLKKPTSFSSDINDSHLDSKPVKMSQNSVHEHSTVFNNVEKPSTSKCTNTALRKKSSEITREQHKPSFDTPIEPSVPTGKYRAQANVKLYQETDDVWLNVFEVPLLTQPTRALPPSRPPPPLVIKQTSFAYADKVAPPNSNAQGTSLSQHTENFMFPEHPNSSSKTFAKSSIDELEFATGKPQANVNDHIEVSSAEEHQVNCAAASSAAAMKEAMDRAEAKFKHARELREREKELRSAKTVQPGRQCHAENASKESPDHEQEQRKREDKAKEQRGQEREQEVQKAAVQKAVKEARERAAAEAQQKAQRAAVEKATAEARERLAQVTRERAAGARERAAVEAREREARETKEREAKEKTAALARVRAKAAEDEWRKAERSAAAAKEKQLKNDHDFDSFFGMDARATSQRKQRTATMDPFDTQVRSQAGSNGAQPASSTSASSTRKASSANILDDLNSVFGAPSSGEFQHIDGESEERRRARWERHQRTQERAAKALAEKNERDMQVLKDQAERHRIAETVDVEIRRWAAGKEGNLRALLSTLQYVLWPECGWLPVSLTDLIQAAAVKKVYRKATLCIHPDKVQQKGANLQQKYIAEKVFDLLKEAWNKFNSEELF